MKKQVKDLKPGDDLGNCLIVESPRHVSNYFGQKDRAEIKVRFLDGTESWRVWGWRTTVTVKETNLNKSYGKEESNTTPEKTQVHTAS